MFSYQDTTVTVFRFINQALIPPSPSHKHWRRILTKRKWSCHTFTSFIPWSRQSDLYSFFQNQSWLFWNVLRGQQITFVKKCLVVKYYVNSDISLPLYCGWHYVLWRGRGATTAHAWTLRIKQWHYCASLARSTFSHSRDGDLSVTTTLSNAQWFNKNSS